MNIITTIGLSEGIILANKYRILKKIGQGNFAETYLVENIQENQEKYVLKGLILDNLNEESNDKYLSLFNGEIRTLNNLNHEQIPKFIDTFQENKTFFLVQEYIEGDNYWQLFCQKRDDNQSFLEIEIIDFLKNLLNVLKYLHDNKIIHRDISPDNIINSTKINKPVLIDFGGVKQKITQIMTNNHKEQKGTMIGKIGYSAPEQLISGECYENSDIYALGATALVLLTGKKPEELFKSFSKEKLWKKNLNNSEKLTQILEKMLELDPKDRYNKAEDVLNDLKKIEISNSFNNEKTIKIDYQPNNLDSKPSKPNDNFLKTFILVSFCMVLGLSGIALILQAPHINAICKKLDNCARDKEYQKIFDEVLVDGKDTINREKTLKNKQDLTMQQESLLKVIKDLQNIPDDVKIHSQAQEELKVYENKLTEIDKKIVRENQADLEFQEIVKKIDNLQKETVQANSINKYQKLKAEWEGLKTKLNEFDGNLLISPQVSNKIIESEKNIVKIDDNLKTLQAQAKAEAERIAIEKTKANTYEPSSSVIRYTPRQNRSKTNKNIQKKSSTSTNNQKRNIKKTTPNYTSRKTAPVPRQIPISVPGSAW